MKKKQILEKGQIYAIQLPDGSFTVAQLVNHYPLSNKSSVDTYTFFNYKFANKNELIESIDTISLLTPIAIATVNGDPEDYCWELIENKEVVCSSKLLEKIDHMGYYNRNSTDPSIFLEPYFGLFPWDGYYKDDYLDKHILPNAEIREDIKYLKDYTTEELIKILPPNNLKLIKRLKEEE